MESGQLLIQFQFTLSQIYFDADSLKLSSEEFLQMYSPVVTKALDEKGLNYYPSHVNLDADRSKSLFPVKEITPPRSCTAGKGASYAVGYMNNLHGTWAITVRDMLSNYVWQAEGSENNERCCDSGIIVKPCYRDENLRASHHTHQPNTAQEKDLGLLWCPKHDC